jgi:glycosyltransferase involved in cell wall biosynthesis
LDNDHAKDGGGAKRIAIMGTGQGLGGLSTHFGSLLRFAVAEGHRVLAMIVADAEPEFELPAGLGGCRRMPHATGTPWRKILKYAGIRRFEAAIRNFKPGLFLATATGNAYARLARSARKGGAFAVWQEVVSPEPMDALHIAMRESVDAVAVQTPGLLKPFCDAIPGKSAVGCLPCFFDPPPCPALAMLPKAGEPVRLAYFGRLAGNKGIVPFLHVFRQVAGTSGVRLDIHGDGEARAGIARAIEELGLKDVVTMKGRYPGGAEYGRMLASCHGLVLPSIDCEGLPLVLLEAMSCGLPLLATDIGGMADAGIGNPDVVITGASPAALGAGLARLLGALRAGEFSNTRLRDYHERHFSQQHTENAWRRMFASPRSFFCIDGGAPGVGSVGDAK